MALMKHFGLERAHPAARFGFMIMIAACCDESMKIRRDFFAHAVSFSSHHSKAIFAEKAFVWTKTLLFPTSLPLATSPFFKTTSYGRYFCPKKGLIRTCPHKYKTAESSVGAGGNTPLDRIAFEIGMECGGLVASQLLAQHCHRLGFARCEGRETI
jgi:hypothetical protein